MAITLTCYTKLDMNSLQDKVNSIKEEYISIFSEDYLIYSARKPDEIQVEISNEFGLNPASLVRIALNNKKSETRTSDIADILRIELGAENVIVLFEGESLI